MFQVFFFLSPRTSFWSVFYRKNNVRQGACENQMLSAGSGVTTIDILYMNYNKKPKTSPVESHSGWIVQDHSHDRKKQTMKLFLQIYFKTLAKKKNYSLIMQNVDNALECTRDLLVFLFNN